MAQPDLVDAIQDVFQGGVPRGPLPSCLGTTVQTSPGISVGAFVTLLVDAFTAVLGAGYVVIWGEADFDDAKSAALPRNARR